MADAGDTRDVSLIPGSGDPLEEETAAHSSVLAWEIPRRESVVCRVSKSQTGLSTSRVLTPDNSDLIIIE